MANDLIVRILGDTRGLERSFTRANQATVTFGRNVDSTGAKIDKTTRSLKGLATGAAVGFGGAFAVTELTRQVGAAIDVASNLQEQISKTNVVFEDSAKVVEDWSKTTASSIGIAQDEALAAASTFGSMFDQAGASGEDAARLAKQIVSLSADLASFNNTPVEDALTALRSGLSGEIEPLRRFQVFLTEASVAQQAMADTGKTSADQLTQGEKILARYSLIMQQTVKQQGDFARTSQGLANQQRILNAQVRDLQASLGKLLVPVLTSLTGDLISGADAASKLAKNLRDLGGVVVPVIEIPLRLVGLDGGDGREGAGQLEAAAKKLVTTSLPGVVGLLDDAIRGEGIFGPGAKPNEQKLTKEFEKTYTPFLDGLENGTKKVAEKAKQTAGRVASFGEEGFKPLAKSVKQVREEREKVAAELAKAAQQRRDVAADKLIAGLQLNIDRAELTSGLRDDLAALEQFKSGLQGLIRSGQDVQENQARLIQTIGQIADKRREIEAAAQEAVQARQFRALGLTATGGERLPAVENLRKQLESLSTRVVGEDIPRKLRDQLARVGAVLSGKFGQVTEETRAAIKSLFDTIRGELDKGADTLDKGPLTKTTSLRANQILEGLGLGADAEREIRARLSSFNTAGQALARGGNRPTGGFVSSAPIVVESHTTVQLDSDTVGRSVTKQQQKQRRRNPKQKRGPNSGV